MDTALVDGYPRRQRRQVTASYYTLLCISFWFRSRGGVQGSFERARWFRDDWPGMAGGFIGVEAEICVKGRDSGLAVSVSTAMVRCVRAQSVACGAQKV